MRQFCIFAAVFLCAGGIFSAHAQDLIVMRDGNIIEAKVTEISPSEIRYKRYDHLDGPTVVVSAANVLSIRYENGKVETFNAAPAPVPAAGGVNTAPAAVQESVQTESSRTTAMNPDKFIFGINANVGGFLSYIWRFDSGGTGSGPSLTFEFGRGNFNSEINLIIPGAGFGLLATFNGFWPRRNGGGYLGGGIGYSFYETWYTTIEDNREDSYYYSSRYEKWHYYTAHSLAVGLNGGYKFVTKSGFYVRTGAYVGVDFGFLWNESFTMPVYIKPDLAIGWTMR